MSKPHGTVIICERENGATVAWEDERLSKEVPDGYFVEVWEIRGKFGVEVYTCAGTDKGYFIDASVYWGRDRHAQWEDPYDAIVWCRDHQRMKRKKEAA